MPKKSKTLCVDDLRHAEYYGMQDTFDELYQKSQNGEVFENLMDLILSRDNILLAYRNIKANKGSYTAGTDKKNITDIGSQTPDDVVKRVRFIVTGSEHGYRPKPVRRKDIPKPNGKTRPLGIPCIWDRLIQQCIKQIMEPICEAKFSNNSYALLRSYARFCQTSAKEKRCNPQKKITTLSKPYSILTDTSYLPSVSTSAISFAVALTIRMPVSLIPSRSASSCRRCVFFSGGVSKRNWSTDIL